MTRSDLSLAYSDGKPLKRTNMRLVWVAILSGSLLVVGAAHWLGILR